MGQKTKKKKNVGPRVLTNQLVEKSALGSIHDSSLYESALAID